MGKKIKPEHHVHKHPDERDTSKFITIFVILMIIGLSIACYFSVGGSIADIYNGIKSLFQK